MITKAISSFSYHAISQLVIYSHEISVSAKRTKRSLPVMLQCPPCFTHPTILSDTFRTQRIHVLNCRQPPRTRFRCRRQVQLMTSAKPGGDVPQTLPTPSAGLELLTISTIPIPGQKTGTSGLRVPTQTVLQEPTFLPNLVQALFTALGGREALAGQTLVVGGDGRLFNASAIQTILQVAAGNGAARVIVGRNGILSTPAASALIPRRGAIAGLILTASHNPGGAVGDWGIKFNTASGAPALEPLTNKMYEETCHISEYHVANLGGNVDLSVKGETKFAGGEFVVEVIDPVDTYLDMLRDVFDFDAIRALIRRPDFSLQFDAMHAVTGEYARRLFVDELGADAGSVLRGETMEDFGGGHPDPNLTYAAELVSTMRSETTSLGAASDGDGDRNMILGVGGVFVNPADSVAIIADHAEVAIPYFQSRGVVGVARSMPTASALDRVAERRGFDIYETPTGWKYFTNLMDAGRVQLCGEESFGTGSDHIREKDGLWAVLCWLSILAYRNQEREIGDFVSVRDILVDHWKTYGRTYSLRHDYEHVSAQSGAAVMAHLHKLLEARTEWPADVKAMDEFRYVDPVDGSVAERQGVRMWMRDGGRVVVRLSGTGSAGATVRLYFEWFASANEQNDDVKDVMVVLNNLVRRAVKITRIEELTGRKAPTVIT